MIGFVSNIVYGLLVKFNCCQGAHTFQDAELGNLPPAPGSARAEAERRR